MAAAVSAETAPCSRRSSAGTPSSASLTSFAYATIAAEEDVARARDRRQPGRDEPAGARLGGREREALLRQRSSTISSTERSSSANRYAPSGSRARDELVRARLGARLDDEVDVDLEVARADRRLDARPPSPPASASARATADSLAP